MAHDLECRLWGPNHHYPIEQDSGGWWFVWSMPVKHTPNGEHLAKGLKKYRTYEHAKMVCSHYNYHRLLIEWVQQKRALEEK